MSEPKPEAEQSVAPWLIVAVLIWGLFALGTVPWAVTAFLFEREPWSWDDAEAVQSLALLAFLAAAAAWLSYFASRLFRRPRLIKSPNVRYFISFLIALFFAHLVFIFGLVAAFQGAPPWLTVPSFFGGGWILLLVYFPTRQKIRAWSTEPSPSSSVESAAAQQQIGEDIDPRNVLGECASVLQKRGPTMLAVAGLWNLPAALATVVVVPRGSFGYLAFLPFYAGALGAALLVADAALSEREVGFRAYLVGSVKRFLPLLVAIAVIRVGTVAGGVLLFVPGVLLAIRWALAAPAVVLGEQGPTAALGTSSRMTKPHQLVIFYTFVPVWAVATVLVFVAAVPLFHAVEIGAENPLESLSTLGRVSANVLSWGAATITTSLFAVVEVVLYRRIESTPLEDRVEQARLDVEGF